MLILLPLVPAFAGLGRTGIHTAADSRLALNKANYFAASSWRISPAEWWTAVVSGSIRLETKAA